MPCICYGAMSGQDAYDEFIKSEKGQETLDHIVKAASIIMSHRLPDESIHSINDVEFRQMFVKCFLHMMVGCDENLRPHVNYEILAEWGGECDFGLLKSDAIKYETYTPESMKSYLDCLAISQYEGWKRDEGLMQGSNLPWISFEHPSGTWMHHWWLGEDGLLTKGQFNPKATIKLTTSGHPDTWIDRADIEGCK